MKRLFVVVVMVSIARLAAVAAYADERGSTGLSNPLTAEIPASDEMMLAANTILPKECEALFSLDPASLDDTPFPSNVFSTGDPDMVTKLRVNLPLVLPVEEHVSENGEISALNQLDGFSMRPRVTIPFSGAALDVNTIDGSNIFFVKIDEPEAGALITGGQFIYDDHRNRILCAPRFYLNESSRYGLVVSKRITANGSAVRRSQALDEILAGCQKGVRPTGHRQAEFHDLFRVLEGKKVLPLDDLLSTSVFTTRTVTDLLAKLRDRLETGGETLSKIEFDVDGDGKREELDKNGIEYILTFLHRATANVTNDGLTEISFPENSLSTFFADRDANKRIFIRNLRNGRMVEVTDRVNNEDGSIRSVNIESIGPKAGDRLVVLAQEMDYWSGGAHPDRLTARLKGWCQLKNVGALVFGNFETPSYLAPQRTLGIGNKLKIPRVKTGPGFVPERTGTEYIQFALAVPQETARIAKPTGGWPVVHYAHGGSGRALDNGFLSLAENFGKRGIATISFSDISHGGGPETFVRIIDASGSIIKEFKRRGRAIDVQGNWKYRSMYGSNIIQRISDYMSFIRIIRDSFDYDGDGRRDISADSRKTFITGFSWGGLTTNLVMAVDPYMGTGASIVPGSPRSFGYMPQITSARPRHSIIFSLRQPPLINGDSPKWGGGFNEDIPLPGRAVQVGLADGADDIQKALDREHWLTLERINIPYLPYILQNSKLHQAKEPKKYMMQFAIGDDRALNMRTAQAIEHGKLQDVTTVLRLERDVGFDDPWLTPPLTGELVHAARHVYIGFPYEELDSGEPYVQGEIAELAREQIAEFFASSGENIIDPDPNGDIFGDDVFEVPIQPATLDLCERDPGFSKVYRVPL
jgi:hypothetical protein